MMDYETFMKTNFPREMSAIYDEIDKEQYSTNDYPDEECVEADLSIEDGAYHFTLNHFEYWHDEDGTIDELKEALHEQIDFYVDECIKAALGREG